MFPICSPSHNSSQCSSPLLERILSSVIFCWAKAVYLSQQLSSFFPGLRLPPASHPPRRLQSWYALRMNRLARNPVPFFTTFTTSNHNMAVMSRKIDSARRMIMHSQRTFILDEVQFPCCTLKFFHLSHDKTQCVQRGLAKPLLALFSPKNAFVQIFF